VVLRHQFLAFVCALGALGAFLHPAFRDPASYRVVYTAADARRAFAAAGLPLVAHSASSLSTQDLRVEVDVFGDPREVAANGSPDFTVDSRGHHVHMPRSCVRGILVAAQWRENVRAVVSCADMHPGDLLRAARALTLLPG
jgi:hypothetical protein